MDTPKYPESALHEHFTRHQARVRRLVRSLLRDEHAAEDIVQDAWVAALQHPPREDRHWDTPAREGQALGAWFGRVAENLALNSKRGEQRRRDREQRAVEERSADDIGAAVSSEEILARLELQRVLTVALDSLEEPYQSLLRDHFLGEQTLAAIARRDSLPESTLRSRLARGLEALRARLDTEEFMGSGGEEIHWSLALAPLALIPRGSLHANTSLAAAGSASAAAATFLGGLASFVGALMMKKAVLLAAAAVAILFVTLQVIQSDPPVASSPGMQQSPQMAGPMADVPDNEEELADVEEVSSPPVQRTEVATTGAAAAMDSGLIDLKIEGSLHVKRTVDAPPPTEVSVSVHSGFNADGEVLSRHSVRSDGKGEFSLEIERPRETVTVTLRAAVTDCIAQSKTSVTVPNDRPAISVRMNYLPLDTVVHGVVFTPEGKPAPGAQVTWHGFEVKCDDEGSYEMRVAPQYVYRIHASHPDYGQTAAVAEGMEIGSRTRVDFTLTPGFDIRGTVRDVNGAAVEGARVATFYGGDLHDLSDTSGQYLIRGFSRTDRDQVNVNARLDGYVMSDKWMEVPAEGDLEYDVVLKRGSRVSGRVVNPAGQPLAGAELCLGRSRNDFAKLVTMTDDRGRFEYRGVAPGERLIWVAVTGYADMRYEVTVPEGTEDLEGVIIKLDEGRTVTGVALDSDGKPIKSINVAMTQGHEYVGGSDSSGEDGTFEIDSLPAGDLTAEAYGSGWVRAHAPVAKDGTVTITVQRTGRVRGRVVDGATGAPVTAFRIRVIDPLLGEGETQISGYGAVWVREGLAFEDPNGRWDFDREQVPAGTVMGVEASATGYAPGIDSHVLVQPEDSPEEVVIELWPAIDVRVLVTVEELGAPIAGAKVTLTQERRLDEMDRSWSGVTDAQGVALVQGAAPGPVWVHVQRVSADSGEDEQPQEVVLGPFDLEPVHEGADARLVPELKVEVPGLGRE